MNASEAALPDVLPLFPLTGVLLLPGTLLPLHAFEPRYRNLVADALAGEGWIGMIQPQVPGPDGCGPVPGAEHPPLQRVGCAGRIVEHRDLPGGRHLFVLQGVQRFGIRRELSLHRGYRRVAPDWEPFAADRRDGEGAVDTAPLLAALASLEDRCGIRIEHNKLADLSGVSLLNLLATQLPFRPVEKQALLEAADPAVRSQVLLTLLAMGLAPADAESYHRPPTLH